MLMESPGMEAAAFRSWSLRTGTILNRSLISMSYPSLSGVCTVVRGSLPRFQRDEVAEGRASAALVRGESRGALRLAVHAQDEAEQAFVRGELHVDRHGGFDPALLAEQVAA